MPIPFGFGTALQGAYAGGGTGFTYDIMGVEEGGGGPGAAQVSLSDLFNNPTLSLAQIQSNIASNWSGIVVGSLLNEISWKVARKLLSKPVNRFNRAVFGKRGIIGNIGFKL